MRLVFLACVLASIPVYSQTTGRVPTGSGTPLTPSFAPGAVGGFSSIPSPGTQSPAPSFTPNPVGNLTPNAAGGFTPNPVGGFVQSPAGNIDPNPVQGLTIDPVTGLSQSPVTVEPTPQIVTTNRTFDLTPLAPPLSATNPSIPVTPSPF